MSFHEVRFPTHISRGATGGPERRTDVVEVPVLLAPDLPRPAFLARVLAALGATHGVPVPVLGGPDPAGLVLAGEEQRACADHEPDRREPSGRARTRECRPSENPLCP